MYNAYVLSSYHDIFTHINVIGGVIVSSLKQLPTGRSTPKHYTNLPYQHLNDVCLASV